MDGSNFPADSGQLPSRRNPYELRSSSYDQNTTDLDDPFSYDSTFTQYAQSSAANPDQPHLTPEPHHHLDDQPLLSPSRHVNHSVTPDVFYQSLHGMNNEPGMLPMTTPATRPSLHSNGDGSTPRHPVITSRDPPRTFTRSVSNPVDNRVQPGPSASSKVSDLKKRFDQSGSSGQTTARKPLPAGAATRLKRDPTAILKVQNGTVSHPTWQSYDTLTNDTLGGSTPRPQRPRHVPEDQLPSNTQSFASRIGTPQASKSTGSFSNPSTKPPYSPHKAPTSSRSQGLLFGEILPGQTSVSTVGQGIDYALASNELPTTETDPFRGRQRSVSTGIEAEPASPSGWYKSVGDAVILSTNSDENWSHSHSRSLSDATTTMSTTSNMNTRSKQRSRIPASPTSHASSSSSRLPVAVRRLASPSGSSSPSSTRPSSPTMLRRYQANDRRSSYSHTNSRAEAAFSRARAPSGSGQRSGAVTPNSNAQLQAHITTPPAKLSPPLRSSRPRQPVSVATTASSRMRAVSRSRANDTRNQEDPEPRRRKLSIGPIDFAQRREHIRLAYSKSIREKQAQDARERAAQRRKKELEAAAKAKLAAEAVHSAAASPISPDDTARNETLDNAFKCRSQTDRSNIERDARLGLGIDSARADSPTIMIEPPAEVPAPVLSQLADSTKPHDTTRSIQSPDLGLPGAFPVTSPPRKSSRPLSSFTINSETTEFDGEPQSAIPASAHSGMDIPITMVKPPSPEVSPMGYTRAEYHYPFEDEPDSPERPLIQRKPLTQGRPGPKSSHSEHVQIPGAFDTYDDGYHDKSHRESGDQTIRPPQVFSPHETPFPRIDRGEESECQSVDQDGDENQIEGRSSPGDAGMCSEDSHQQNESDECVSVSPQHFYPDSHRGSSSCASHDEYDEYGYASVTVDNGVEDEDALPASRPAHLSAWTDFSVDSREPSIQEPSPRLAGENSPTFGHVTIYKPTGQRPDDILQQRPRFDDSEARASGDSVNSTNYFRLEPQPFETSAANFGDDLNIPHLSRDHGSGISHVPTPGHGPLSIPQSTHASIVDSSRASSTVYDQSHVGSVYPNPETAGQDFASPTATPLTSEVTLVGQPDNAAGSQTMKVGDETRPSISDNDGQNEKERKRLTQRRNVIMELVDTEAVFVRDMNIVEEIYKGTAEACPKLDDKTVKLVFRNTEEIIEFHTFFLAQVKESVANIYVPTGGKARDDTQSQTSGSSKALDINDVEDRMTLIGPVFLANIDKMKTVHEGFLRNSDQAAKRLIQIQQDPAVKVWLNECNEVAKELTAAWDLDSLLIKPMQRITKYPNLIITLLQHTPEDHPDREHLMAAKDTLETAIIEINQTKKNFELVGSIVSRKRKESDVRAGFARAFGKRVDKLQQTSANRPPEDPAYSKLHEKFGDDYLRLQVVLRDVEFYTRQVTAYVHEFLQYLSSIELVMRLHPGSYPELESKWVQFNISVRDLEKVALEEHLQQVRKRVIEPFEKVIKAYGNPSLAMKKRGKRRLDFERYEQLKRAGRSIDSKLKEQIEQYEALNATLIKELPQLSALTERIGNICLGNFVDIQTKWFGIWKNKMKLVLSGTSDAPDLQEIVSAFNRDFPYAQDQVASIGILNPVYKGRPSQSTSVSESESMLKVKNRPPELELRGRGQSVNDDTPPSLPTPDFLLRNSGSFVMSPGPSASLPSPHQYYYRDYYSGASTHQLSSGSLASPEISSSSRSHTNATTTLTRPSTGRSYESGGIPRQSSDSVPQYHRDSTTAYNLSQQSSEPRRLSGLFHSALPLPDGPEESRRSSRASSRDRGGQDGYRVLWLAASLFEFNINTTKMEAGYPYLIYQAGEIFDVIAEKGELWLAKNQDDPTGKVGWIWSKHFAKLADS